MQQQHVKGNIIANSICCLKKKKEEDGEGQGREGGQNTQHISTNNNSPLGEQLSCFIQFHEQDMSSPGAGI